MVKRCCFIHEAFPRFDFIQYSRQALSYVLVQVIFNNPLVMVTSEASTRNAIEIHDRYPDSAGLVLMSM